MVKLSEVKVGQEFKFTWGPVTREMIKEYAKTSGDHNNIHTDDEYAQKMGLKGVIAHGMLSFGVLNRFVSDLAGDGKVLKTGCEMRGMVRPGDDYVITATIKAINGNKVDLEVMEMSKTKIKIEKGGNIVKKFEAEERGWVTDKDIKQNLIHTEETPEGTLHYRLRLAIPAKATLELKD